MGLRTETREFLEEEEFKAGEKAIVDKYYTDPDADMRGLFSGSLHKAFVGEYEPSPEQKRMMELELENYRLTHGQSND